MNKNTEVLRENLTKNGFSISVPRDDFIIVKSPLKDIDVLKEFFIRCHGSKVVVFLMLKVDDILQGSAEAKDLAFVLSSSVITQFMQDDKIDVAIKEDALVFSAIINSYPIFPFTRLIYSKTYDKFLRSSVLLDTVVNLLQSELMLDKID
jgi:hypothetical protein